MKTDDEVKQRYDHEAFIGRSKRAPLRRPSLKSAVKHAYDQAVAADDGMQPDDAKVYRVLDIWAVGTNPLSEYIVALGREG